MATVLYIPEHKQSTCAITDLLGDLSGLFDNRQPVQDCTTMTERRERKKQDDEQRM